MNNTSGMRMTAVLLAVVLAVMLAPGVSVTSQRAASLPEELSDAEFWRLVTEFSEPNGLFPDENYVSNETRYQAILPRLVTEGKAGGVYLGVGPEQNFTYLTALQPQIAFVIDIRRQNAMQHLLYKALFELSADRADFVSRLFSRPRPPSVTTTSDATDIFRAYTSAMPDRDLFNANLAEVFETLTVRHGFGITEGDRESIAKVLNAFYENGPEIMYVFQGTAERHATYVQLMTSTDGAGKNWSFLATETFFQRVRQMQRKNLVIPVVGDFGGPKALRAVGQYVRERGGAIHVFYVSNVEPYLFTAGSWRRFYENVATMPVNANSVFIRTFFGATMRECSALRPAIMTPHQGSITEFLRDFDAGRIATQCDLVTRSSR